MTEAGTSSSTGVPPAPVFPPPSAQRAEQPPALTAEPLRTHPHSLLVISVQGFQSALLPMVAAAFSAQSALWMAVILLGGSVLIAVISGAIGYLRWRRFTYHVGETDIRVESGLIARAARSVPYERIQDVSLEQTLLLRLLGLAQVKFETGAGGQDEIVLRYLSKDQGEMLRELVRTRKGSPAMATAIAGAAVAAVADSPAGAAHALFVMGPKRLITFGLFEFSLAVFAVLAGLFQYADNFVPTELWDTELWETLSGPSSTVATWKTSAQISAAVAGFIALCIVGSATGLVRTALRDWNFILERTEKGFRRRRGLLTKTDVVMPVHRVQALTLTTGFMRRRFGWYGLRFVSLAQDSGGESHDVAPFGTYCELEPVAGAAGFAIKPEDAAKWHRNHRKYRIDTAITGLLLLSIGAITATAGLIMTGFSPLYALLFVPLGGLVFGWQLFLWRFDCNALDPQYLFIKQGWFAPRVNVASRVKLQSVEIAQGPIARRRGYATLKLGLAGSLLEVNGLPLARAHQLRGAILESISATDFSKLAG